MKMCVFVHYVSRQNTYTHTCAANKIIKYASKKKSTSTFDATLAKTGKEQRINKKKYENYNLIM